MVNINSIYSSAKLYKSEDIKEPFDAKITAATMKIFSNATKIVLTLEGHEMGLVANATNSEILAKAYGEETDNWVGKMIHVSVHQVKFKKELVPGIEITPAAVQTKVA